MARRIPRSISFRPDQLERLDRMRDGLPGMTRSGIVEEVLDMTLPIMEELLAALQEARNESGDLDEAQLRDRLALWTGQQLLTFTDPGRDDH